MSHNTMTRLIAIGVFLASAAGAQTQRSGSDAQRFMQQYQQIAAEKTALQTQLDQAKKDLEATKGELLAAKKERDALKAHTGVPAATVTQLTASRDAAERSVEQSKQRMNELIGKFRDMAANLKEVEADRTRLREDLAQRNVAYDKCAQNNFDLYQVNGEILDRYEHVGVFTRASAAEPFTRLTRTRIENLVDEYRERALQLREKKTANAAKP